jgi:hypothetical protein
MRKIEMFLDDEGRIKQLPSKGEPRRTVLAYLATKFSGCRDYTEKEVNTIIDNWHTFGDYFVLRRELINYQFLYRTRDGVRYWKEEK